MIWGRRRCKEDGGREEWRGRRGRATETVRGYREGGGGVSESGVAGEEMRVDNLGGFSVWGSQTRQDQTRPGGEAGKKKKSSSSRRKKKFQSIISDCLVFLFWATLPTFLFTGADDAALPFPARKRPFHPGQVESRAGRQKGKKAMGMWGAERAAGACPVGPWA